MRRLRPYRLVPRLHVPLTPYSLVSQPHQTTQPEIREAAQHAFYTLLWHIVTLRATKSARGALRCATGELRMRLLMLREYRVSDRPLSFRPSGSEWRNLRGAPPNRRTGVPILCAVAVVVVREGPISACGARWEARQDHQAGADVREFGRMGKPQAVSPVFG